MKTLSLKIQSQVSFYLPRVPKPSLRTSNNELPFSHTGGTLVATSAMQEADLPSHHHISCLFWLNSRHSEDDWPAPEMAPVAVIQSPHPWPQWDMNSWPWLLYSHRDSSMTLCSPLGLDQQLHPSTPAHLDCPTHSSPCMWQWLESEVKG